MIKSQVATEEQLEVYFQTKTVTRLKACEGEVFHPFYSSYPTAQSRDTARGEWVLNSEADFFLIRNPGEDIDEIDDRF